MCHEIMVQGIIVALIILCLCSFLLVNMLRKFAIPMIVACIDWL